jgi:hypothetical protein
VFVRVNLCDFVCPSTTLPKAKLAGEMLNPAWAPAPVKAIVRGELAASLVTVTPPDALPALVGANTTLRVTAAAAFKVKGVVIPFTVKPAPLVARLEMLTGVVPVLLTMMGFVELLPVLTLPKLTDEGFACNCPNGFVDPVPVTATLTVGVAGSLLVMDNVPVAAPATVGWNVNPACTD